jgi:hypothetical protein
MTSTNTDNRSLEIARNISRQIPKGLQMALGIREKWAMDSGLQFKMTGTRAVIVEVTYTPASDLYDVEMYTQRMNRTTYIAKRTVRYKASQIDAGQLVQILDLMDRGQIEL